MNLRTKIQVFCEAFKEIMTFTDEFSTTTFSSSDQTIRGENFPLVIFEYGSVNQPELKPSYDREKNPDGTFNVRSLIQCESKLVCYSKDPVQCADILLAICLLKTSEDFTVILKEKSDNAGLDSPPSLKTFNALTQDSSIDKDNKFLHKSDLDFSWEYSHSQKARLPCFREGTYPQFKVTKT